MAPSRLSPCRAAALLTLAAAARTPDALAAERLPADVFAGYSFAQIDDVDRHGVNLAVSFPLAGTLGGFVDVSAHWGTVGRWKHQRDLTAMAGPGVRLGRRGGPAFFLRGLVGVVTDRTSYPEFTGSVPYSHSSLGLVAGGGVDVPIGWRLALRAQGDCLLSETPDRGGVPVVASPGPVPRIVGTPAERPFALSASFRASGGIVYRFGGP